MSLKDSCQLEYPQHYIEREESQAVDAAKLRAGFMTQVLQYALGAVNDSASLRYALLSAAACAIASNFRARSV